MAPVRRLYRPTLKFPRLYSHVWAYAGNAALAAGAAGLALGLVGYALPDACGKSSHSTLDVIWKAFALLVMQATPDKCDTWMLQAARLLAATATLAAVAIVAITQLHSTYKHLRLSRLEGHTVVLTLGDRGRSFIRSLTNQHIVTLDLDEAEWPAESATAELHAAVGDASNESNLAAVNVRAAAQVIILGDDDTTNLQILQHVLAEGHGSRRRQEIVVRIENETLARVLNGQDSFVSPGPGTQVLAFNEDRVAAIRFNDLHPLAELADRRAQERVHLVIVGQTPFALAALEQFVRISPYGAFRHPRVDMFVEDPDGLERLFHTTRPAFLESAVSHDAGGQARALTPLRGSSGASPILELHLWSTDRESGLPDPGALELVEAGDIPLVTAVLVSSSEDADAVAQAIRVREMSLVAGRWTAPIFVRSRSDAAVTSLRAHRDHAGHDPQFQIIPVGLRSDTCSAQACFGAREEEARRFHAAYLRIRHQAPSTPGETGDTPRETSVGAPPTDRPWERLPAKYKARNRRAVDHLPNKLLSAGCVLLGRPLVAGRALLTEPQAALLTRLAALEHDSWDADMRTDGWQYAATRDDARQLHTCVGVPYDRLDPGLQAFDIDQVRYADGMLDSLAHAAPVTVRRETRLGVFGHNRVSIEEFEAVKRTLVGQLDTALGGAHTPEFVSILTPLAPGADTLLTELTLDWLQERERPIPHRLLVVRALPRQVVTQLLSDAARDARIWSTDQPGAPSSPDAMMRRLEVLEHAAHPSRHPTVVADLQAPGRSLGHWMSDDALRTRAFQRANAYIAQRAHVVMAFVDDSRTTGRPGGAAEALAWCRDPSGIPADLRLGSTWRDGVPTAIHVAGITPA